MPRPLRNAARDTAAKDTAERDAASRDASAPPVALGEAEKRLINRFQRGFPLSPRPFAEAARALGMTEDAVLAMLADLGAAGVVDRVGPVMAPHRAGWSTLAAMSVPSERLAEVAAIVSADPHVNHNYEREHAFNLWFVVTAPDQDQVADVLAGIAARTGLEVMDLPLLESYHINLGFPLP